MTQKLVIALGVIIFSALLAFLSANKTSTKDIAQVPKKNCLATASVCSPGKICGPQKVKVC